jgi:membrane-associated PAP2 superfamily phosphatase
MSRIMSDEEANQLLKNARHKDSPLLSIPATNWFSIASGICWGLALITYQENWDLIITGSLFLIGVAITSISMILLVKKHKLRKKEWDENNE